MRLCNAKGPSASSSAAAIESKPKGQDERAAGSKPEGQDDAKVSKDRRLQVGDDELDELNTSVSDEDKRWIGEFLFKLATQCIKAKGATPLHLRHYLSSWRTASRGISDAELTEVRTSWAHATLKAVEQYPDERALHAVRYVGDFFEGNRRKSNVPIDEVVSGLDNYVSELVQIHLEATKTSTESEYEDVSQLQQHIDTAVPFDEPTDVDEPMRDSAGQTVDACDAAQDATVVDEQRLADLALSEGDADMSSSGPEPVSVFCCASPSTSLSRRR